MRVLGVDFGQRRLGLALSDATGAIARPWKAVPAGPTPQASAEVVSAIVAAWREDDWAEPTGVDLVVVGVPRRLNGEPTDQTGPARKFADALRRAIAAPVLEQDERLSSHEADQRLAAGERDWRRRKAKLDAAAAAVILQDYLDHHPRERPRT